MAEDFRLLGQQIHGTSCEKKSTVMHPETCVEQILLSHEASDTLKKWITTPPNGSVQRTLPFEGSLYQWLEQNYPINSIVDLSDYYNRAYIDQLAASLSLLATLNRDGIVTKEDYAKIQGIEYGSQKNIQADWEETNSENDSYIKNKPDIEAMIREIAVGVKILVVEQLPVENIKYDTIYFVPNPISTTTNVYNEYVRIKEEAPLEDHWEMIGSTALDLSLVFDEGLSYNTTTGKASTNAGIIKTTEDIPILGWSGQIGSGTYQSGDTIPANTPIQTILKSLFFKLLYPTAATKPSLSLSVGAISPSTSTQIVGSLVTIPAVSFNTSDGTFNANYTNVSQPTSSIEWNRQVLATSRTNGFTNYSPTVANTCTISTDSNLYKYINGTWTSYQIQSGDTIDKIVYQADRSNPNTSKWGTKEGMIVKVYQVSNERTNIAAQTNIKVALGTNKITYSGSAYCTESFTDPVKNDNTSTTKISEDAAENSAKWEAEQKVASNVERTIIGVLPCYNNISGSSLIDNASTQIVVSSGTQTVFTFENIPSEVTNNKHFKFEFPSGTPSVVRTISSIKIKDLSGNWIPYAATYTVENAEARTIDSINYPYSRLITTGSLQGVMSLQITLSDSLNK